MPRFPEPVLLLALAGAAAAALLAGTPLPAAARPRAGGVPERVRVLVASNLTIDELRLRATQGNHEASTALAMRLLDRYESGGGQGDLDEALTWIARDWKEAPYRRSDAAHLVTSGHCVREALKTHWLCRRGD